MLDVIIDRLPGKIYILMSSPPGPTSEFIEVEDSQCKSISIGRWVKIKGVYALEIDDPRVASTTPLEAYLRRALLPDNCSVRGCGEQRFRVPSGAVCAVGHEVIICE